MNVNQVLNQIQDTTLSEVKTENLIKYLYDDIINSGDWGGGYDYFVESYSSEVGRFDEQRDVEIIESLYSRRVYSPNSNIQKHELERLEGLLDICKNKHSSEVWETIEGFMDKPVSEMNDEEFENQCRYERIEDYLNFLNTHLSDLLPKNNWRIQVWKKGISDKHLKTLENKIKEVIGKIDELDSTIIELSFNNKQ